MGYVGIENKWQFWRQIPIPCPLTFIINPKFHHPRVSIPFYCYWLPHCWEIFCLHSSCLKITTGQKKSQFWSVECQKTFVRVLHPCWVHPWLKYWVLKFLCWQSCKSQQFNHFFVHNCLKAVLFWNLIFKTFCCHSLWTFVGVMPPDEYVINVNNSAFTNMVAIRSLEFAASVALYLGLTNHTIYSYYACHIYMPFDRKLRYHPEYDGYILGKFRVKTI